MQPGWRRESNRGSNLLQMIEKGWERLHIAGLQRICCFFGLFLCSYVLQAVSHFLTRAIRSVCSTSDKSGYATADCECRRYSEGGLDRAYLEIV